MAGLTGCADPGPHRLTLDLATFARRVVIAGIKAARGGPDDELKERVMLARQCGFLTDEEAEFYIAVWGLTDA